MAWLGSRIHLAIERSPTAWTYVAARHDRRRDPELVAAASFDMASVSLSDDLRRARTRESLPSGAALVLWPEPDDDGVAGLDTRARATVVLPKAHVIRQRVAPFVRAGGHVREVLLPHEAVAYLAARAGWASACVVVIEATMVCVSTVEEGRVDASYLTWSVEAPGETETSRLLARYQFAARLVPHLHAAAGRVPQAPVAVCGRLPDLRSAMVPIMEEFDREVEVLDAALVGPASADQPSVVGPDQICEWQLAWSVATNH